VVEIRDFENAQIYYDIARRLGHPGAAEALRKFQPSAPPQSTVPGGTAESAEARLQSLEDLKAKRLITEEEYQSKRKEILGEL
jgi:hypothetical protein